MNTFYYYFENKKEGDELSFYHETPIINVLKPFMQQLPHGFYMQHPVVGIQTLLLYPYDKLTKWGGKVRVLQDLDEKLTSPRVVFDDTLLRRLHREASMLPSPMSGNCYLSIMFELCYIVSDPLTFLT